MGASPPDPEATAFAARLVQAIRGVLGERASGIYAFGSFTTGDFEPDVSDLDIVVATAGELEPATVEALRAMHRDLEASEPDWADRLDVAYVSERALRRHDPAYRHPYISPGEPFQAAGGPKTSVLDRLTLLRCGVVLLGRPISAVIDPIDDEDMRAAMHDSIAEWRDWLHGPAPMERRDYQSYTVLTMCRFLRTAVEGDFVSKREAARWMREREPSHAALIDRALVWRASAGPVPDASPETRDETLAFADAVLDAVNRTVDVPASNSDNRGRD